MPRTHQAAHTEGQGESSWEAGCRQQHRRLDVGGSQYLTARSRQGQRRRWRSEARIINNQVAQGAVLSS